MEMLVASLLLWIAGHSSYNVSDLPGPHVVVLHAAEYRERLPLQRQLEPWALEDARHSHGYFDRGNPLKPTIYLLDPAAYPQEIRCAVQTLCPAFQGALVHQLVHYAQWVTDEFKQHGCLARGEVAADSLTWNYQNQQGLRPALPSMKSWTKLIGGC